MTAMPIRDVRLFVEVVGRGYPLALMHGGPGGDHWTMLPFRQLTDRFTVIFYNHRCNGRSVGAPVTSMTWENLTADADVLRQRLGFEKWAVLGHSFGGKVALEYALRYPESLSHLILLDAGGDSWWDQENAPELLARRGFQPQEGGAGPALVQRSDRALGVLPDADEARHSLRSPHELLLGHANDAGGAPLEGAAAGGDLRFRSADEGLDGHGPPQRDQGADVGDGRTGRLRVPARALGTAGGRDPQRTTQDH